MVQQIKFHLSTYKLVSMVLSFIYGHKERKCRKVFRGVTWWPIIFFSWYREFCIVHDSGMES